MMKMGAVPWEELYTHMNPSRCSLFRGIVCYYMCQE
jgi:hypothetical protein